MRDVGRSIWVVSTLLIAILLGACGEQTEADRYGRACGDSGTLAYDMTVRFVAGDLGNPKNADFPYLSRVRTRKPDPEDPCTWLIYGYVDLEKASSAIDHRRYIMTIVYSGNNRWRMKELHWQAAFKSQKASGAESP